MGSMAVEIETPLAICTDVHINKNSNPQHISDEIYKCLQRGHIYLVSPTTIYNYTNKSAHNYYDSILKYEDDHFKTAQINKDSRRELRSLQRQIITMLTRLRYFATGFNVPNFINLSDGRRLRLMREHIHNVKDILHYLRTVPPLIDIYKERVLNLTFVTDEQSLLNRDQYRQQFHDSLEHLKNWIREQYV